jgi:hypothetical protein
MRSLPLLLVLVVFPACGVAGSVGGLLNNGHAGLLSINMESLAAEGQHVKAHVFRRVSCGDGCEKDEALTLESARCADPAVCHASVAQGAMDTRFPVALHTLRAGLTELEVTGHTADGTRVEDRFCLRVVKATSLELTCAGCAQDLPMGGGSTAECRLFNRAVTPRPLLGTCQALPGGALEVTGVPEPAGDEARVDPDPSVPVPNGVNFQVRRVAPGAGHVVFQYRGLHHRVDAR